MREILRKKLPKTRGWYTGIILGILAVVGVVVWLIWRSMMAESPQRTVNVAIEAARASDAAGLRALLSAESVANPMLDGWLKQFTAALAKPGVRISDVNILRDHATVKVAVPHQGATGGMETTDVGIRTVRSEEGWLIDLQGTMASANIQFWEAVAAEGG